MPKIIRSDSGRRPQGAAVTAPAPGNLHDLHALPSRTRHNGQSTRGTMTTGTKVITTGLFIALIAGCAGPKKTVGFVIEEDVSRVIRLRDGTTCVEPAALAEARRKPGALKLKEVFESDEPAAEALAKARDIKPTPEEAEAVYFDACRDYSTVVIPKWAFERDKALYLGLHQQQVAQAVKEWQDKKSRIADPAKLSLITLPDTDPAHRSSTRLLPAQAADADSAQLATP